MTKKYTYIVILLVCFFASFLFPNISLAFSLGGCSPIANPENLCQEQTWYPAVDVKLEPSGTQYFVTLVNGVFSSVPNCNTNAYSMLLKNVSVPSDNVFVSNGQYGFCDYGSDLANAGNVPDGNYFYELYSGNSWGSRVAFAYILFSKTNGVWSTASAVTNGACGTNDGQSFHSLPSGLPQLCAGGDAGNIIFNITNWTWDCISNNGGTTASCSANYSATARAVAGACGTDNGQTLTTAPTDLCSLGTLDNLYFINTGWNWRCLGVDGGAPARCSAINSLFIPPDIPTTRDCSTFTGIENWICGLQNTMSGIFLPSPQAKQALETSIDAINEHAPLNYVKVMSDSLDQLQLGKSGATGINFTINGKSGTINDATFGTSGALHDFMILIKVIASFVVILIFVMWGLSFIKRIFK